MTLKLKNGEPNIAFVTILLAINYQFAESVQCKNLKYVASILIMKITILPLIEPTPSYINYPKKYRFKIFPGLVGKNKSGPGIEKSEKPGPE